MVYHGVHLQSGIDMFGSTIAIFGGRVALLGGWIAIFGCANAV